MGAAAALCGGARGPATGLTEPQPTKSERGRVAAACLPFPLRFVLEVKVALKAGQERLLLLLLLLLIFVRSSEELHRRT
jgi:hypothetical protein